MKLFVSMGVRLAAGLAFCLLSGCGEKQPLPPEPDPVVKPDDPPSPTDTPRTFYVSVNGRTDADGLSPATALKGFAPALERIRPGDVVKVMPGTYEASWNPVLALEEKHSGKEGAPITFEAQDPSDPPVISAGGKGVWNAVTVEASYIVIDGFELRGQNSQLDSLEALRRSETYRYNHDAVDWNETARYNTNGISIGKNSHATTHVTVRNCKVHDFPGGGIGVTTSDYITLEGNTVYNNAWFTMYACSGISVIHPVNSDSSTGYKIIIRGNRVYNNRCMIPWCSTEDFRLSDGNGIILDINQRGDAGGNFKNEVYGGRTLVCNNLSVGNGGSGIHSFKADHVDIVNNTACGNGFKYPEGNYPQIFGLNCTDVRILNNIMVGLEKAPCNGANASVEYGNNLYFGGTVAVTGVGDETADPLFVRYPADGAKADFHLSKGSPAIGLGRTESFVPSSDLDGLSRSGRVDSGCYQYTDNPK